MSKCHAIFTLLYKFHKVLFISCLWILLGRKETRDGKDFHRALFTRENFARLRLIAWERISVGSVRNRPQPFP